MAALEGFIDDPEIWFDFVKKRNLTVHTYHEKEAEEVIAICPLFSAEIKKFLKFIGVRLNAIRFRQDEFKNEAAERIYEYVSIAEIRKIRLYQPYCRTIYRQ